MTRLRQWWADTWVRPYSLFASPWARVALLVLYYLAIIAGLVIMYGRGNFSTPPFIYQGF